MSKQKGKKKKEREVKRKKNVIERDWEWQR